MPRILIAPVKSRQVGALSSGDNEVHCDNIERVTTSERTPPPFSFPGAFLLPSATTETGELKEIKE